jgi:SAM-dependent methyltransferase
MNTFWDDRFLNEGKIWGNTPSRTAICACERFERDYVKSVLVPGCGYGRNAVAFYQKGFEVTGIEMSGEALALAEEENPGITYYQGSVLDMPFDDLRYDGIYCYNVLHLFCKREREIFVEKCKDQLAKSGLMFFAVFSDKESSYGKGRMIEENTFESKPGRFVHYYTKDDLIAQFPGFSVLETGLVGDFEDHGEEGRHTHTIRYIYLRVDGIAKRRP